MLHSMNTFRTGGEIANGAVEGLNKGVATMRSYGLPTCNATEVTLYHTMERLLKPESNRNF
jgi:hypothetical protein